MRSELWFAFSMWPMAGLILAQESEGDVIGHDLDGGAEPMEIWTRAMFDRGPYGVGIDKWASLMHNATHLGNWPISGFNVSSPDHLPMEGWSVTFAANNWIDARTTLYHRLGEARIAEMNEDDGRQYAWAGTTVRLNPPESLYEVSYNRSYAEGGDYHEIEGESPRPHGQLRHKNWRVCAYQLSHLEDPVSFMEAPNNGTCGGTMPEGCMGRLARQTISSSFFNNKCPYEGSLRNMEREGHQVPNDTCLPDFIRNEASFFPAPARSLDLLYERWSEREYVAKYEQDTEDLGEEYDWLHGSEISSDGLSTTRDTRQRLGYGIWGDADANPEGDVPPPDDLLTVSQGLLLVWVHNENGLDNGKNESSLSNVTFSIACFNGVNQTEKGRVRLAELRELELESIENGSAVGGARVTLALVMSVLAVMCGIVL